MSIEGNSVRGYQATHYEVVNSTGVWVKSEFKDYKDNIFESRHIRLKVLGTQPVYYSFDPSADKVTHGELEAGEILVLLDKSADEIYVMRAGIADSDIAVYAWR